MNEQTQDASDLSRPRFLKSTAVGLAAASTLGLVLIQAKRTRARPPVRARSPSWLPNGRSSIWRKSFRGRRLLFRSVRINLSTNPGALKVPRSIVNGPVCRPRSKSSTPRGRPITSGRLVGSATKSFVRTTRNQRLIRFNTKPGSRD
jgi:hypothetical protein